MINIILYFYSLLSFFSYREVNKTLRDENDTLRAMIDSNKSVASTDVRINKKKSLKTDFFLIIKDFSHIKTINVSNWIYS